MGTGEVSAFFIPITARENGWQTATTDESLVELALSGGGVDVVQEFVKTVDGEGNGDITYIVAIVRVDGDWADWGLVWDHKNDDALPHGLPARAWYKAESVDDVRKQLQTALRVVDEYIDGADTDTTIEAFQDL